MGLTDIKNCIRFAKKYPELVNDVDQLPWRKIANELLIENPKKPFIPSFPDKKYGIIYADPPWQSSCFSYICCIVILIRSPGRNQG